MSKSDLKEYANYYAMVVIEMIENNNVNRADVLRYANKCDTKNFMKSIFVKTFTSSFENYSRFLYLSNNRTFIEFGLVVYRYSEKILKKAGIKNEVSFCQLFLFSISHNEVEYYKITEMIKKIENPLTVR